MCVAMRLSNAAVGCCRSSSNSLFGVLGGAAATDPLDGGETSDAKALSKLAVFVSVDLQDRKCFYKLQTIRSWMRRECKQPSPLVRSRGEHLHHAVINAHLGDDDLAADIGVICHQLAELLVLGSHHLAVATPAKESPLGGDEALLTVYRV